MKIIEAYECDFCSHTSLSKFEVEDHEKNCIYNPLTRHCYTCGHFKDIHPDCTQEIIEEAKKVIPNFNEFVSFIVGDKTEEWFNITYCRQMESSSADTNIEPFFKCKKNCKLWVAKNE